MNDNEITDDYRGVARLYDPLLWPFLHRIRRDVARIVRDRRCTDVLDVCCGTGRQLRDLSRAGMRLAGLDRSPSMLEVARKKSPREISLFMGDARALPFPSSSFNAAIVSFALHEMPADRRGGIVSEAMRVLAPGGCLLLVDYAEPRTARARFAHSFIRVIERLAGEEHFRNFLDFIRRGGLEGLATLYGLEPVLIRKHALGAIGIAVIQGK